MLFILRSKRGRFCLLAAVGLVLAVLFFGFGLSGRRAQKNGDDATRAFDLGLEDSRKVAGFVESFGPRIDETEKRLGRKELELDAMKTRLAKHETVLATLADELARRLAAAAGKSDGMEEARQPGTSTTPIPRLQKLALALNQATPHEPSVRLPAGSFAEGTLLTGVYAPTEGGVLPVKIRLDAAFVGPNRSRIPLGDAFLIGKAVGDPNSQRVVIQLDRLSYVASSGKTFEIPVNGYVADSDGVQGLAGSYVWRITETAAVASVAGGLSAAAEAAAQQETVTQINPLGGVTQAVTGDLGKYAVAKGASRAAGEIEKIVARRLEQIVPAIYIANGKKLTVCLIEGATLEGLTVREVTHGASNPYAGLDSDR